MNTQTTGAVRPTDEGTRIRRRQYRITARLLREYTARVYEIADRVGMYVDQLNRSQPAHRAPPTLVTVIGRFRLIWEDVLDAALSASQMLVHYSLDEADAAELRIRLKDAEHIVGRTAELVNDVIRYHKDGFGLPMTADRLKAVIELSRLALKR